MDSPSPTIRLIDRLETLWSQKNLDISHQTQVTLVPVIMPLEALNTCIHTSGLLKVTGGHCIRAVGAPVSTNGVLDNDEMIDGDAEANSIDTMKTITGTLTVPAARVKGAIICEDSVVCEEQNTIIHNSSLYAIPPEGYTYVAGMKVSPESYKQVVDEI